MLLLCFFKRWEERLAKEGTLAPRTREKFSANFKGVAASLIAMAPTLSLLLPCLLLLLLLFVFLFIYLINWKASYHLSI